VFPEQLEGTQPALVTWQTKPSSSGSDQPEQIAAKHGMTLAQLKEANDHRKKKIAAGADPACTAKGTAEPNLPDLPAPK